MIIANGTIETISKTGGGINATTGFPENTAVTYGTPVPCQWRALSFDRLVRSSADGSPVTKASYEILIEGVTPPSSEEIRLKDASGAVLGIFSSKNCEMLNAVRLIRLTI